MIGRILRIVVVVLILLACWRVGQAYMAHYRFADDVDQIAQSGVRSDPQTVLAAVSAAAAGREIPINADQIEVRLQGEHVYVDLKYVRPIEVLPRYMYRWPFEVHAHGWIVAGGVAPRR